MNTFKKRLSEAIKSVFNDLDSMSSDEFRSEIKKFIYDQRTDAILYAWDSVSTECYDSVGSCYELKEMLQPLMTIDVCYKNIPSLFFDDLDFDKIDQGNNYKKEVSSDDYYLFKAAA